MTSPDRSRPPATPGRNEPPIDADEILGAHSRDEHLLFSSLEPRARLMLRRLETLE